MPRQKARRGFWFKPDTEYMKQTMDMPAHFKLKWLEEVKAFTDKALSKKTREVWERFRRGEM